MKNNYTIKVTLESETIFGSGNSLGAIINEEVLHDEFCFPYYNAKTLKGKIRKEAENICGNIETERLRKAYINLFGSEFNSKEDQHKEGSIKFSNLTLSSDIRNNLRFLKSKGIINKSEILDSFTNIRQFIKVENDIAVEGALRSIRTLKEKLEFESKIECDFGKGSLEEALLFCSVGSLKYLGMSNMTGKGLVKCELLEIENPENCISEVLK